MRLAPALIAAGVASAASVVSLPAPRGLPAASVDVATALAVTDALSSLGKGVEVASSLVGIHVDATISLPFEATLALMAAQRHPELAPNVLSYLVQRFVNPAVGPPITAYPWLIEQTVALPASVLPYPLGPNASDPGLINEARLAFGAAFNGVLGQLPDSLPGFEAVRDVMNNMALGGAVVAGQLAVRAPLYMAWSAVNYLGNLPVNLAATFESALSTPNQIPGLISNLVYGLLSSDEPSASLPPTTDVVVTGGATPSDDAPGEDAEAQPRRANHSAGVNESSRKEGIGDEDGKATVRPGTPKQGDATTPNDQVTGPSFLASAEAEPTDPVKAVPGAVSGGSLAPKNSVSGAGDSSDGAAA